MENVESQGMAGSSTTAGSRLRQAREAAGLSRSDIATRTKIAERHLIAIEEDRFGDLAARTYAVGFSRAYARALGLNEAEIAEQVRRQLDAEEDGHAGMIEPSFEPGDPARVPPLRMAWVAGAGVVVVVVLLLVFWSSFLSPEGKLPDLIAERPAAPKTAAPAPAPATSPVVGQEGPVVMTATADAIWVKVTDANGKQLLQKELALGESWTVPSDADGPQLRTGRPDALKLTVGGRQAPALADKPVIISGVSLKGADLLARGAAPPGVPTTVPAGPPAIAPPPAPPARPTASPAPGPSASRTPAAVPASRPPPARTIMTAPVAASGIDQPAPEVSPTPKATLQPVSTISD